VLYGLGSSTGRCGSRSGQQIENYVNRSAHVVGYMCRATRIPDLVTRTPRSPKFGPHMGGNGSSWTIFEVKSPPVTIFRARAAKNSIRDTKTQNRHEKWHLRTDFSNVGPIPSLKLQVLVTGARLAIHIGIGSYCGISFIITNIYMRCKTKAHYYFLNRKQYFLICKTNRD
jgi:hypothetical protein